MFIDATYGPKSKEPTLKIHFTSIIFRAKFKIYAFKFYLDCSNKNNLTNIYVYQTNKLIQKLFIIIYLFYFSLK